MAEESFIDTSIETTNIILIEGCASGWQEAISLSSSALLKVGYVNENFYQSCVDRELVFPTGLETNPGVAMPHTGADHVVKPGACFLRLKDPVAFNRMDDPEKTVDVKLVFNLALPSGSDHIKFLQQLATVIQDKEFLQNCLDLPLDELRDYFIAKQFSI